MRTRRYGTFSRRKVLSDAQGKYVHYCGRTRLRAPLNTRIENGMTVSVINVRNMGEGVVKVFTDIHRWELWGYE